MNSVSKFLDTVGRQDFRQAIGVPEQALTRAVRENVMPSGWYMMVRDFCRESGVDVPENLFRWSGNFKSPKQSTSENAEAS